MTHHIQKNTHKLSSKFLSRNLRNLADQKRVGDIFKILKEKEKPTNYYPWQTTL